MRQIGIHTWEIIIQYHRCPKCGNIIESREDYENRLGKFEKDLKCERCRHQFTITKPMKPALGPLLGKPQPVEFDWTVRKKH